MTELIRYLKVLYRNKYILIFFPLLTMGIVYYFGRSVADQYKSQSRIATGLVDKSAQVLDGEESEQESEINRKFDSMIQMMYLKKILDQVSYALVLHDLQTTPDKAFRGDADPLSALSVQEKSRAIAIFKKKYQSREELSLGNAEEKKLRELLEDLEIDDLSIQKDLAVYRKSNSDYITIEYEAPAPLMSAFIVNTLGDEFILYYSSRIAGSNNKAVGFLYEFMIQKQEALAANINVLKEYKIKNRVLNLNEQAKTLYGQIADFETRREVIQKDIQAYTAAIRNIDKKFDPTDRRFMESAMSKTNQEIVQTKERLKIANENYIRNNFDVKLKPAVDSLKNKLDKEISSGIDKYAYSPLAVRENLINQKLSLEISLEMALNSSASVLRELDRLNTKFDRLVPNEAKVQEYESSIEIASKEYIEALQRYNEKRMGANFPTKLQVIERAMPGLKLPSKKKILVLAAGIACFSLCLLVFFVIYFFDESIREPEQLANSTNRPVLGQLNVVKDGLNKDKIFDASPSEESLRLYHSLIRSLRYELLNDSKEGAKVFTVSSLCNGEGKTSVVLGLAWAFARTNKRVLIIDGNFGQPELTTLVQSEKFAEFDETHLWPKELDSEGGGISLLGNEGGDVSIMEIVQEQELKKKFQYLRSYYDIILVEADSFSSYNKAKEWTAFSDYLLMVFESGKSIKGSQRHTIQYLKSLDSTFVGWVLNKRMNIS